MMSTQQDKREWVADSNMAGDWFVMTEGIGGRLEDVAAVCRTNGYGALQARQMAAAPDMVRALADCIRVMENELKGLAVIQPELSKARAAYAKATQVTRSTPA